MAKKTIKKYQPPKSWWQQVIDGEKYTTRQIGLFFLIFGTLLYINTVKNVFSIDDSLVTQSHPLVTKGFAGIPEILTTTYLYDEGKLKSEYRPLTQISYAIEYEFFGENPHISHFINALLYGVICLLIYKLFCSIFDKKYHLTILIGVLIFAVHPLHTEVVASLKNRENILGALFGLLSTIQILRFIDSKGNIHFVWAFIFLLLGISAKIDTISFMVFFILLAIYRKSTFKKALWIVLFSLFIFGTFSLYKELVINPDGFRNTEFYETPLVGNGYTFLNTIALSLSSLWWYLRLELFPYPLRFYYGTGLINLPKWTDLIVWASLIIHSILLYLGIIGTIRRKFYGFAIMWYLGGIFLFIQLLEPITGIIAERHAFISSIGFSMFMAFVFLKVREWLKTKNAQFPKTIDTVGIVVLCVFALMVFRRNKDWYDATTLYQTDAPKLESSIFFHFEYANQYARNTGIDPSDTLKYKGNLQKSIEEYKKVLHFIPDHKISWYNMGVSYIRMGEMKDGYQCFIKARELDSNWRAVDHLIGLTSLYQKDTAQAIRYFEKELVKTPNNGGTLNMLYEINKARGDWKANIQIGLALEKRGLKTERLYKTLANSYYFSGNTEKAFYYRKKVENHEYSGEEKNDW